MLRALLINLISDFPLLTLLRAMSRSYCVHVDNVQLKSIVNQALFLQTKFSSLVVVCHWSDSVLKVTLEIQEIAVDEKQISMVIVSVSTFVFQYLIVAVEDILCDQ